MAGHIEKTKSETMTISTFGGAGGVGDLRSFEQRLGSMYHVPDDKSILLHELCAFWNFSQQFALNRIVESGTYKGLTAKRLSLLYPHCKIYSFEKRKERFLAIPKQHLADNLQYRHGQLSMKYLTSKTALLIDGPKRMAAIELAQKARKIVPFVGIHDMGDYLDILKTRFKYAKQVSKLALCR